MLFRMGNLNENFGQKRNAEEKNKVVCERTEDGLCFPIHYLSCEIFEEN